MLEDSKPVIFIAALNDTVDYTSDLAWLKRIGLEYYDEKMEREKIITAFFKEMIIEGMPVTSVVFPEGNNSQQGYFRVILTLQNFVETTVQFPNTWEPPMIV
jgi:hypothetical protein